MMNATNRTTTIRIGEFEVTSVWDGTLDAKVDTIRNLSPDEVERRLAAAREATGIDPLVLPARAFVRRRRSHGSNSTAIAGHADDL